MSRQDVIDELLRQEDEKNAYLESQMAYEWLLANVYANEEARV